MKRSEKRAEKAKLTQAGSIVCLWCRDGDGNGTIPHHDCPFGQPSQEKRKGGKP